MNTPTKDAEGELWDAVEKGIVDCLHAHGPVTHKLLKSAAKRVVRNIVELCQQDTSELSALALDSLDTLHRVENDTNFRRIKQAKAELIQARQKHEQAVAKLQKETQRLKIEVAKLQQQLASTRQKCAPIRTIETNRDHALHQITNLIARQIWLEEGCPEGRADHHWRCAERAAKKLLEWKPDGEHYFVERAQVAVRTALDEFREEQSRRLE